jgi:hypothetical protein
MSAGRRHTLVGFRSSDALGFWAAPLSVRAYGRRRANVGRRFGLVAIVELIGCMLVCIRDIRGFLFGGLVPVLCSTPVIFLEPFRAALEGLIRMRLSVKLK